MPTKMCKNLKLLQFIVAGNNATDFFLWRDRHRRIKQYTPFLLRSEGINMEFADVKVKGPFATIVEAENKVVMENLMQGIYTCINASNARQRCCRIHGGYKGVIWKDTRR